MAFQGAIEFKKLPIEAAYLKLGNQLTIRKGESIRGSIEHYASKEARAESENNMLFVSEFLLPLPDVNFNEAINIYAAVYALLKLLPEYAGMVDV